MGKILSSKEIGNKVKVLRQHAGLTQEKLAELVGVSFQQIQKYENGSTKMNTDKLQHVSKALKVPVSAFFEDNFLGKLPISEQEHKMITAFRALPEEDLKSSFVKIIHFASRKP